MVTKLKIDNPKDFATILTNIAPIVNEVKFKLTPDGLTINAIDPANVCMLQFKVNRAYFSEYTLTDGERVWCVSLESLNKMLSRGNEYETIFTENENKVTIQMKPKPTTTGKSSRAKSFELSLIEIESEDKDLPKLDFVNSVIINSVEFNDFIEDSNVVADACQFKIANKILTVEAKGALNSFKSEYNPNSVETDKEAQSKFSLEYLQKIAKNHSVGNLFSEITINLGNNYPLKADFKSKDTNVNLTFVLAPRVSEEE